MRLATLLGICLFVLILVGLAAYTITDHSRPKETFVFEYDFTLTPSNELGFNLDQDKMHFGNVCVGCTGLRRFDIQNNASYSKRVRLTIVGENSHSPRFFTIFPASGYIIAQNETRTFALKIKIPKDEALGFHEGRVIVELFKAWPWQKNSLTQTYKLKGCFSENFWDVVYCKENKKSKETVVEA